MTFSILFLESEKAFSTWQLFVQNSHQRIKHFRADLMVYKFVLLVVHVIRLVEYFLNEPADLLLVTDPIVIMHVLTLLILVNAFVRYRGRGRGRGRVCRRCSLQLLVDFGLLCRLVPWWYALHAGRLNHALHIGELDAPLEWHVGEHNSNVLGRDVAITIEIEPI